MSTTLAFLGFLLGVISIFITLQYVKICDATKILSKAYSKTHRVSDLDRIIFSIQEQTGMNDQEFKESLSNRDIQNQIASIIKKK